MPAYVIANLRDAAPHPEIAEYIERLPATLDAYGGRYLVHATPHEVKEGTWPGDVVMIGFPSVAEAQSWWDSPENIGRSRHCAHGISRATSSWWKASPRVTRPLPR